jgi:DNA-binding protein H-NS
MKVSNVLSQLQLANLPIEAQMEALDKYQSEITKKRNKLMEDSKKSTINEIASKMLKYGVNVDEVINKMVELKNKQDTKEMKYQNPNDPTDQITGKGNTPNWFKELKKQGLEHTVLIVK